MSTSATHPDPIAHVVVVEPRSSRLAATEDLWRRFADLRPMTVAGVPTFIERAARTVAVTFPGDHSWHRLGSA